MDRFRRAVCEAFWANTQVSRREIFGEDDRPALGDPQDFETMWPGFVGERYGPGGVLLVANYPAGGTKPFAGDGRDLRSQGIYEAARAFRAAELSDREPAFASLNAASRADIPHWSLMRVIETVLTACRLELDDAALINVVPYRVSDNRTPDVRTYTRAWDHCTGPALETLQPGEVVALGVAAGRVLRPRLGEERLTILPRRIGDRSVPPEAAAAARKLAGRLRGEPEVVESSALKIKAVAPSERPTAMQTPDLLPGPKRPNESTVHGIVVAHVPRTGTSRNALLDQLVQISRESLPPKALANPSKQVPGSEEWWNGYISGCLRREYLSTTG